MVRGLKSLVTSGVGHVVFTLPGGVQCVCNVFIICTCAHEEAVQKSAHGFTSSRRILAASRPSLLILYPDDGKKFSGLHGT